jgi:hypothetical protein
MDDTIRQRIRECRQMTYLMVEIADGEHSVDEAIRIARNLAASFDGKEPMLAAEYGEVLVRRRFEEVSKQVDADLKRYGADKIGF